MMKRTIVFMALFALLPAAFMFGQDTLIPYVDVAKTQAQIEVLNAEIVKCGENIKTAEAEIVKIDKLVADLTTELFKLESFLPYVSDKGGELYTNYVAIKDPKSKQDALVAMQKNEEVKDKVSARIAQLKDLLEAQKKPKKDAQLKISTNKSVIKSDQDKIVLLEASISKTKKQQEELNTYMDTIDKYLTDADSLLKNTDTK
jgi:predicted  nucleic acid-binding Zn-ribbon protein